MERTTTREGALLPGQEAEALRRLSRLETMMEDVLAEEAAFPSSSAPCAWRARRKPPASGSCWGKS